MPDVTEVLDLTKQVSHLFFYGHVGIKRRIGQVRSAAKKGPPYNLKDLYAALALCLDRLFL